MSHTWGLTRGESNIFTPTTGRHAGLGSIRGIAGKGDEVAVSGKESDCRPGLSCGAASAGNRAGDAGK